MVAKHHSQVVQLPLFPGEEVILLQENLPRVQPFLKWAGGKGQLLPELKKYFPKNFNRYIEPMVGAGALFFYLLPEKAILADLNEEIINCYEVIRNNVEELMAKLQKYKNDEKYYYLIRSQDPEKLSAIERAARTIFLNKTCYNGLYRVNKKGEFNVPFGRRKNPLICDCANLQKAHESLQGVELIVGNYLDVLHQHARPGDFIFLDPPYHPSGGYADFKRYTKEFFYEEDHIALRDELVRLVKKGCWVLLTNSNTEFVRKLYEGFDYAVVDSKRNISSNPDTRNGQDLIVMATRPPRKTASLLTLRNNQILENFPGTKYMGSKYRVIPFLWDCLKDLKFNSVLDAFSGSACVSYMFKQKGKLVISNDFIQFAYHFAKAIIENSEITLDENDKKILFHKNKKAGTFISDTFAGMYFSDEENRFLDLVRANIELLGNPYKKSLALAALVRACIKRRPRGIFTFTGERYDDGRRDFKISLEQHFLENISAFNSAVFDNGEKNVALGQDVFNLNTNADLIYMDPPYLTPNSDNDYCRRYHFVEGLVRQWNGIDIQHHTSTKKFKKYESLFSSKDTIYDAFDSLFAKYNDRIIVLSYSSNSIPEKGRLVSMLKKYKKRVRVQQIQHLYSFSTHPHKVGNKANQVHEFIFVGY